jgi:hypothetical protein
LLCGDNTVALITDVIIPHSIRTIERCNENHYFIFNNVDLKTKLTSQNYDISSLAQELVDRLNEVIGIDDMFNSLINETIGQIAIEITTDDTFYIYDDETLRKPNFQWNGVYYDVNNLKSCNEVIGNFKNQRYNKDNPFITGFINMMPIHHVYLSNNMATSSYGPRGERNILKKICVDKSYGELITDNFYDENYSTDVSKLSFNTLEFTLRDSHGNIVDLHGQHISFTIILKNSGLNF